MGWTSSIQTITQKGRKPYYRLRLNKKDHYLGTDLAIAHQKASEILGAAPVPTGEPKLLAQLVARWLAYKGSPKLTPAVRPWLEFAEAEPLACIGADHLGKYAEFLSTRARVPHPDWKDQTRHSLKPGAVRRMLLVAHSACKWGHKQGWLTTLPDRPQVPRASKAPRDIPIDELRAVLDAMPVHSRRPCLFIALTGCRPSEAVNLRWSQVNWQRGECRLADHKTVSKTGRPRTIYLHPDALELLKSIARKGTHVFLNSRGTPYCVGGLACSLKRRGISSIYALRHSAAQFWLEQGTDIALVAKLLGHSGLQTVQIYAQVRDEQARRVAQSLPPVIPTGLGADRLQSLEPSEPEAPSNRQPRTRKSASETER